MKLGRTPSLPDRRDLRLATYLTARPTAPPSLRNWTRDLDGDPIRFDSFGNFTYGCCTCAALGHIDQAAASHTRCVSTITTDVVLEAYDAISEWSLSRPNENDNGASCRDALKWFKARGTIESYVRLDEASRAHIEIATNLGGAVYVGADLPLAAQKQTVWDVAPANGWTDEYARRSWGGHAMALLGYDHGGVTFATWGRTQRATWSWFFSYCDEAWMAISDLWTDVGRLTPSGFDLARLLTDVAKVAA